MSMKKCGECIVFIRDTTNSTTGRCHKHAPYPMIENTIVVSAKWPPVNETDQCGEAE